MNVKEFLINQVKVFDDNLLFEQPILFNLDLIKSVKKQT